MILTRVSIENYKHFAGPIEIEIPAQATIGVIGENGAGKTTLFEAMEWCLYGPKGINANDVRPRAFTGPTRVLVYLESVDGSQQFIVERVLKRTPSATVYKIDPAGDPEPIVQGVRQVSDYVTTNLIGLTHTAFTATFFTRQKELHLFGNETAGKRREEIGKLLGLETIRSAQRSFTGERSRVAAEARAMLAQVDRETAGRDFLAESQAADSKVAQATSDVSSAVKATTAAEAVTATTAAALTAAQDRRDALNAATAKHQQLTADRSHAEQRIKRLTGDIAEISGKADERARHVVLAERKPGLEQAVAAMQIEQRRHTKAAELDRNIKQAAQERSQLTQELRRTFAGVRTTSTLAGWYWDQDDSALPRAAADRLVATIDKLDIDGAATRERSLRELVEKARDRDAARKKLDQFLAKRRQLEDEAKEHLREGDPRERQHELQRQREQLLADITRSKTTQTALETKRDSTTVLIGNLQKQDFGDSCPTCGRPFSSHDAAQILSLLREQIGGINKEIAEIQTGVATIERQINSIDVEANRIRQAIQALDEIRGRIDKSEAFIESQREQTEQLTSEVEQRQTLLALDRLPDAGQVAAALAHLESLRAVRATRHTFSNASLNFISIDDRERAARADREALGEVAFDESAFNDLNRQLREANHSVGALEQIDLALARKPALEQEREELTKQATALDVAISEVAKELAQLADAHDVFREATRSHTEAQRQESAARNQFHQAQLALQRAEHERDVIAREQARLARLVADSNKRQREADDLDLMAKEMTEFERYAAGRKIPLIADYASSLVNAITDGRYERVEFDPDFGIQVFDGENSESSYPLETFSGGERDVITLSARLALSQMIGRQATNQPGFLVLDEVFGSLDSDRRANLLDLLGKVTGIFDELRQVFIISHVDDVRTSPTLDELWRVEHGDDGSSTVRTLDPGAEIDTL